MSTTPTSLALTTIADGSQIIASTHRNNDSAIQTAVNAFITFFSGGLSSQVVTSGGGTTINYAYPPGYEYVHTEFTSNVTVSATTEATANTIVTASAVTFDGSTIVKIEFWSPFVQAAAVAGAQINLVLYEDGVSIGGVVAIANPAAAAFITPMTLLRRRTPASGARTYSVRAYQVGGNGTVGAGLGGLGAALPGFIRITKA